MDLTYNLTENGYVVLNAGAQWLTVECDPATGLPFDTQEAAQAHAQALLLAMAQAAAPVAP